MMQAEGRVLKWGNREALRARGPRMLMSISLLDLLMNSEAGRVGRERGNCTPALLIKQSTFG